MEYLLMHNSHPTADEIYGALSPKIPTLSKMTVYNTLNMLAELGAILVVDIDERNRRFDADTSFHAHFMCRECNKIYDFRIDTELPVAEIVKGAEIDDIQLLVKGRCSKCVPKGN